MGRGVNKAIIIGTLGRDPELRHTQSGAAVCNFSVATNESYKKDDDWVEETEWHNIVVWNKVAENCEKYLSKGSSVFIEGSIKTRKWDDKEGNTRYTTEIKAFNVQFLDGKSKEGGERQQELPRQDGYDPNSDVPF